MAYHGVTVDHVLGELGIDASQIGGGGTRLNTGVVDDYLRRAKGTIDAILVARGIDPAGLNADHAQIVVESAVLGYAVARAFRRLGRFQSADSWWQDWQDGLDWARNREGDLGNEVGSEVDSNVDTSDEKAFKFKGSSKKW